MLSNAHPTEATKKTFCRNCTSLCGVEVDIKENRIIDIRGDADHPITEGYICIKGKFSKQLHNGQERLVGTQKRGADGIHHVVTTRSALDDIAHNLASLRTRFGPRSIGLYLGTGVGFGGLAYATSKAWLKGVGSPDLFSSMTIDQSAKWVAAGRMGSFATGKPALQDLDVMLIIGNNPLISHLGTPASPLPAANARDWLRESRLAGLKVIVIDPRQTETARSADLHLAVKPGEDAVLLASIIKLILDNSWENKAFCKRFVSTVTRLHDAVKDFSVEFASRRTGLPANLIEEAARIFGTARRRSGTSGTGPNMAAHSNVMEHLLEALNAICGGYRKAGDPIRATGALYGLVPTVETVVPPQRTWELQPKCRSANAGLIFGEFPTSRLPGEILHKGEDRIRALICLGGNPAKAIANTRQVVAALRSLELLVAIDLRMTETARLAHYVIPTKLPYEREDLTGNSDNWFYKNFVQYTPAMISPPADTLDDWEVFWELAHRMNTPMHLKMLAFGVPYDSLPPGIDLNMASKPSTHELLSLVCGASRLTLKEIEQHPSGLTLADSGVVQPMATDDGHRLQVCPDDVAEEIRGLLREPDDVSKDFPYQLTCRRMMQVMNTAFHEMPEVMKRHPVAPIFMHPDDISLEKLEVGALVELRSKNGTVVGRLAADITMRRGVLSMPHGWGDADPDARLNALTCRLVSLDDDLQSINYMPLQSGIPINIHPIPAE